MTTDNDIIDGILEREGSTYTDRAADRGGPTRYGVTLDTLRAWRAPRPVAAADVAALTEDEARAIYLVRYIRGPGFDQIADPALRELVVDAAVMSGPRHATEWLQKVVGVRQDGQLGPVTLIALTAKGARRAYLELCGLRMRILGRLVALDRSQAANISGWLNRVAAFVETAPLN